MGMDGALRILEILVKKKALHTQLFTWEGIKYNLKFVWWSYLGLILYSLLGGPLRAQNLVPNSSFEEGKPACHYTYGGENIRQYLTHWYSPTGGTADYWVSDSTVPLTCSQRLRTPAPLPHSGNRCVGILTTVAIVPHPPYREYMQIKLSQPLQKGKTYSASLFAHLFLDTGLDNVGIFRSSDISTNNIGMYFSVDSLIRVELEADRHGQLLTVTPQVNSARILDDAQHWAQVSGCFVAQQDYQYLTIGNFFDDAHTYKQKVYAGYSSNLISYYLIDDISVELVQEKPLTTLSIGPDTVLCPGQVLSLNIPDTARLNYQWQDGKLGRTYTITKSGTYWVTAIQGKCMISDTIHVQVLPPVRLPADTVLCEGESLSLVVDHPLKSYQWNTQSTDSTLVVNLSGIYWIQVISNHCWLSDSIQVQFVACPGEVPNVITPNEDGKNDRFVVAHADLVPWQLGIYNRWGRQVYFNTHYQNEWDGGGLPAGTYYYHLWSPVLKRALKGWLMILR